MISVRTVMVLLLFVVMAGLIIYQIPQEKGDAMALAAYRKKRDFDRTSEPAGNKKPKQQGEPIFVIHKHAASHLHYDLRLEIEGVMPSWAIPKGPSSDPAVKRLAVQTEDHPYEYASFEGVIPQGEYGGGTVMIWDTGTYENIREKDGVPLSMEDCLKQGMIEVIFHGKRMKGAWALLQTSMRGDPRNWLLVKMNDRFAKKDEELVSDRQRSAVSGKTMQQIAQAEHLWKK